MTCIAQLLKLTHGEQKPLPKFSKCLNTFAALYTFCNSKLHFLNALITVLCIRHNKSHVCHFKPLPFKMTLHELIGQYTLCATNTSVVSCYHFNQEASTMKRPQVNTLFWVIMRGGSKSER